MVQLQAHRTLRLEVRRSRALFRGRTGGPWEVRVTHADGRLLARVPAGTSAFAAGRVHEEMCGNLRLMTEDQFLQHYGEGDGDDGGAGVREPRRPTPSTPPATEFRG